MNRLFVSLCALALLAAAQADGRAYAEGVIGKSDAPAQFVNQSHGPSIMIRHRASGLACALSEKAEDQGHDSVRAKADGSEAACVIHVSGFTVELSARRLPAPLTADQALSGRVAELKAAHPEATPYEGEKIAMTQPDGPPRPRTAYDYYRIKQDGHDLYVRLAASVADGWLVEERVTGPLADGGFGELLSVGMMFVAVDGVLDLLSDDPRPKA